MLGINSTQVQVQVQVQVQIQVRAEVAVCLLSDAAGIRSPRLDEHQVGLLHQTGSYWSQRQEPGFLFLYRVRRGYCSSWERRVPTMWWPHKAGHDPRNSSPRPIFQGSICMYLLVLPTSASASASASMY
jgi:hypothetical protein